MPGQCRGVLLHISMHLADSQSLDEQHAIMHIRCLHLSAEALTLLQLALRYNVGHQGSKDVLMRLMIG